MDVDKVLIQSWFPCHHYHQSGHLTCDCPCTFDIRTMTNEERLELLPELPTLAESTEVLSTSTDLDRPAEQGPNKGLSAEEPSKENFGSSSG